MCRSRGWKSDTVWKADQRSDDKAKAGGVTTPDQPYIPPDVATVVPKPEATVVKPDEKP